MQCTGAANPDVLKWTITRRGPVMTAVIALALGARFGLERVALRFCF